MCFGMSRGAFKKQVAELRSWISKYGPHGQEAELAAHMSGRSTRCEVLVAIFLRIMAGGAVHDICALYGMAPSTCYKWFNEVLGVVFKGMPLGGVPSKESALRRMAVNLAESRPHSNPLPGCIGALDGIQVVIEKPQADMNPLHFYGRKGFYALTVQAIVDSDYHFLSCSSLTVGIAHDPLDFRLSSLNSFLEASKLPKGFWVYADEAYAVSDYIIIPFSRSTASLYQDGVNFFQSSHRLHVQQAFCILKSHWGILWRPLKKDMGNAVKIMPAAMKLHNFCIDHVGGIPKLDKTTAQWMNACEDLDKWLKWVRTGVDVDSWMHIVPETIYSSASRAERKFEIRRKLLQWIRGKARLRPEPQSRQNPSTSFIDIRIL